MKDAFFSNEVRTKSGFFLTTQIGEIERKKRENDVRS